MTWVPAPKYCGDRIADYFGGGGVNPQIAVSKEMPMP